jgi:hypothetical protein
MELGSLTLRSYFGRCRLWYSIMIAALNIFYITLFKSIMALPKTMLVSTLNRLKIFHPYGTIADLPWQEKEGVPFGFRPNRSNLEFMNGRIRTYTEEVERGSELDNLREEIRSADTLVFLGFSFHPENMKILNPGWECNTKQVFASAYNISSSDVDVIRDQIRMLIGRRLEPHVRTNSLVPEEPIFVRNDLKCSRLLEEYSRRLFIAGCS